MCHGKLMRWEPDSPVFHVFVTNQLCDLGQVVTPASKVVVKIKGNMWERAWCGRDAQDMTVT